MLGAELGFTTPSSRIAATSKEYYVGCGLVALEICFGCNRVRDIFFVLLFYPWETNVFGCV